VNLFDEARDYMVKNVRTETQLRDVLVAHMQLNEELAKKAALDGRAEISSATWAPPSSRCWWCWRSG